ncbi:STD1 [Candida theae]|uniref:STD1 n=1 Tax=Candida theae TaxID=1198502 RepID=A0AAD5G113_9ASCO|nr:STD1 [Candida theae]KAI5968939.1 STD1 [Candida theae]
MYASPFSNSQGKQSAPSQFKENARNEIYNKLPSVSGRSPISTLNSASSVRSAPSQFFKKKSSYQPSYRSSAHTTSSSSSASIFSSFGKRSVRSAPSIYSSSTGTIPEDSEPLTVTVEQLVNDISLHESHFAGVYQAKQQQQQQQQQQQHMGVSFDPEELYKISLGSGLTYQNNHENLIDWNLNVTRCKLMLTQLPSISTASDQISYNQNFPPQLIGDLAQLCHLIIIQPHISDTELIFTLIQSNLYEEHNLDLSFKKSVAEISVKQSRLLQINEVRQNQQYTNMQYNEHDFLKFKFKEIALRNYLINLAAAATTANEYKLQVDELKRGLKLEGKKKLSKDEKKQLWEQVRSDVFKRAGLE